MTSLVCFQLTYNVEFGRMYTTVTVVMKCNSQIGCVKNRQLQDTMEVQMFFLSNENIH